MAHWVTCVYCKERFDRDKEPTTQISARRYAHKECAEKNQKEKSQEEKDLEQLEAYIMKLFNEPYVNARIRKQIKDYKNQYDYTYSGMLKTLIWFYEIKGNSIDKANGGIGIIPYVYKNACDYYYSLYIAKLSNESKNVEEYKPKVKEIEIFSPAVEKKKPRLFNLDDEAEEKN